METSQIVIASSVVFTSVMTLLVVIILIINATLTKSGKVKLGINLNKELEKSVDAGSNLLATLTGENILLPSACGGGGTCGMCKCVVTDGGGDVLPTELGHLNRAEQKSGVRLACQVKVRDDMEIEIPDEIFNIKNFNATVRSNDNQATFIKELVLELDDGQTMDFKAGGYIQINIPQYSNLSYKSFDIPEEYRADWDKFNLWHFTANNPEDVVRAYSMANHPAEGNIVMLDVRIASPPPNMPDAPPGISSSYIFNLKKGDKVVVSGPYGEFFVQNTQREMCFIGGGAGMAPMRSHIFDQFHTNKTDRKVTFWYGARSKKEMFYQDHFDKIERDFPNFKMNVAMSDAAPEDNWTGYTGFIHQVLHDEYLSKHPEPENIEYYLCGPPMMISAVNQMLDSLGVEKDMIRYDEF